MTLNKLSEKQKDVLQWCHKKSTKDTYDCIICDGAVRSGKTIVMITSFVHWAMRFFNGHNFGICGKTVRSAERNIIIPMQQVADLTEYYSVSYTRSINMLTVKYNNVINQFYIFGGKDESSYALIQGITLSGVLFDEVALMPRSFVEQAIARTLSIHNAKNWFNCNPENPNHWFYKEWICEAKNKNALHIHFLMTDNPIMTAQMLVKAYAMYTGVFYDRYILGEWVRAEGLIYRLFADNKENYLIDNADKYAFSTISFGVDFGGSKSATTFTTTGITRRAELAIILDEKYIDYEINPDDLNNEFAKYIESNTLKYGSGITRADSAEQILIRGLIRTIQKLGLRTEVRNALKMEIKERIRLENLLFAQSRIKILRHCIHTIEAFENAVYDPEEEIEDIRLDNGTSNIDSLDSFEYSLEPFYRELADYSFKR